MSEQAAQEPTMEEILASIRRIISEDDAPAGDAPVAAEAPAASPEPVAAALAHEPMPEPVVAAVKEEEEDILDLTQPMDEPEDILVPAPAAFEPERPMIETLGDLDAYIAPPSAPAPAPRAPSINDGLVSDRSAASVAGAFGQLSSALAMPAAGRTLEDVTRELLRPLLKDWLDQNLARIVEVKVEQEVERLARLSR